MNTDLNLKLN